MMHSSRLPSTEEERKQSLDYLLTVQLMILQAMAIEKTMSEALPAESRK